MATLVIRNVPPDVAEALTNLAKRQGISVNALLLRELGNVARWSRNDALLDSWPSYDISADELLLALDEGRAERDAQIDRWLDRP
jgi:hypothetical protein